MVVGEDVDLLCLLIAGTTSECADVLFMKPGKSNKPAEFFSVQFIQEQNPDIKENILVAHALSGCDTTSAVYGKGKITSYNVLKKHGLHDVVAKFNNPDCKEEDIFAAGCQYILKLYGAKKKETSLDSYRFSCFIKSSTKTTVYLASLPPTLEAMRQHALRVYHQIQKGKRNFKLPTQWGWTIEGRQLEPVRTRSPPAPESLLKLISCSCVEGCLSACGCRKAGESYYQASVRITHIIYYSPLILGNLLSKNRGQLKFGIHISYIIL